MFVGVSLDRSPEEGGLDSLRRYVSENAMSWPQYYQGDGQGIRFSEKCGVYLLPTIFVLGKDGKLASKAPGDLESILEDLLKR